MKTMKSIAVIAFAAVAVCCFSSCISVRDPYVKTSLSGDVVSKDYEILGTVSVEGTTHNVLLLFSWGGTSYKALLEKAQREFGADAVMNIYEDSQSTAIFLVYNSFTRILTGTAIRYIND